MDATEFDSALAKTLRLCRSAAELQLPIEEMLAYAAGLREEMLPAAPEMLAPDSADLEAQELAALQEIIAAVGDVAAIGARLPADASPTHVPSAPEGGALPLPANLRSHE